MQTKIFWICGVVFFAVQMQILFSLLRHRRRANAENTESIHAEIIWTLVPAALVTAIALMIWQQGPLQRTSPVPPAAMEPTRSVEGS